MAKKRKSKRSRPASGPIEVDSETVETRAARIVGKAQASQHRGDGKYADALVRDIVELASNAAKFGARKTEELKAESVRRGLVDYAVLRDGYGSVVRVRQSSTAGERFVWIFCDHGAIAGAGPYSIQNPAPHLNVAMARELVAALTKFINGEDPCPPRPDVRCPARRADDASTSRASAPSSRRTTRAASTAKPRRRASR